MIDSSLLSRQGSERAVSLIGMKLAMVCLGILFQVCQHKHLLWIEAWTMKFLSISCLIIKYLYENKNDF